MSLSLADTLPALPILPRIEGDVMPVCFCGQPLDGNVHAHTGSVWCFPDEPDIPDRAEAA